MSTVTTYRLPPSLPDEIEGIRAAAESFRTGELSADAFKQLRVPQGIYAERDHGTHMLRVRLPAGMIRPAQMHAVADLSEQYANGVLHITTRQDIQIHGVAVENLYPVLCGLFEVGLSTKAGGGNTVRNITACPHAGTCWHEALDVTPFVVALTEKMIADPTSSALPRKCKITFSGCGRDCGGATVTDIGFIAHRNGTATFAVYVGGGLGAESRIGECLEPSIPLEDCYAVAEAIKRVFIKHGDRQDRKERDLLGNEEKEEKREN